MSKRRDIRIATLQLKQAFDKNVDKISTENLLVINKLDNIKEILTLIKDCKKKKNFIFVADLEKHLSEYEDFLDKKYWNDDAIFYLVMAIACGVAQSLS